MLEIPMRTRFAPSPTGRLHLGHVLAARVAHALARTTSEGEFLLRFEDIDVTRVRPGYVGGIEEDLRWLGLDWDGESLCQTTRLAAYEEALTALKQDGWVYPCFCTRREIQREWASMASAPQGPEGPPYPGTCRKLSTEARESQLSAGVPHAWRLDSHRVAQRLGQLDFFDLAHGRVAVRAELGGDVVLARKDIGAAYHLAVVVDDAYQQVSHVTRGEDLLAATHVHRILQEILGLPQPVYLHHALVCDASGQRLAKRAESYAIHAMRAAGMCPEDIMKLTETPFQAAMSCVKSPGLKRRRASAQ